MGQEEVGNAAPAGRPYGEAAAAAAAALHSVSCSAPAHPPLVQEAALETLLANLATTLQLPAGALGLDSLSEVAPPTSELAVSSGTRRLTAAGKATSGPVYLTATLTLDPDATAEADGGAQFSAAWLDAELRQAAAEQPSDAPVQLASGSSATR